METDPVGLEKGRERFGADVQSVGPVNMEEKLETFGD